MNWIKLMFSQMNSHPTFSSRVFSQYHIFLVEHNIKLCCQFANLIGI